MLGNIIVGVIGIVWLISVLYKVWAYKKTIGAIKSVARSGANNPSVVVKFTDNEGEEHIYTTLNTSWGKKGSKRRVYYKPEDPIKVYAINWFDFFTPIVLILLSIGLAIFT